jgi:uncharacterized protein
MDKIIPVRMDTALVQEMDEIIKRGIFKNRNEGIREGIRMIIKEYTSIKTELVIIAQIVTNYLLLKYPNEIVAMILYGSVARGTANEESDIDLMILSKKELEYSRKEQYIEQVVQIMQQMPFLVSLHFEEITQFVQGVHEDYNFEMNIITDGRVLGGQLPDGISIAK